ncbi:hypothetical protein HN51_004278 [Arachis hypogaea]|nr:uncharacterized protein LOC112796334 [Arachis hypogaea]QHO37749.1 uncharacterized protein DS421_4g114240 [Arachis hypogaea]
MKHNFSTLIILICFSLLSQSNATFPRYYHHQAHAPETSQQPHHPFGAHIFHDDTPGAEATHHYQLGVDAPAQSPSSHGGGGLDSSSFYSSFSDLLKGTLRGHTLTMPDDITHLSTKHHNELRQICGHTDYPDVCFSTIAPHLHGEHFDLTHVLQASITACSIELKLTIEKSKRHSSTSSPENLGAVMYVDCRVQYTNALENLQKASDAAAGRDLGTVTIMLSSVMADVATCESGFQDLESSTFVSGSVGIMASNCLTIAHMVPHQ